MEREPLHKRMQRSVQQRRFAPLLPAADIPLRLGAAWVDGLRCKGHGQPRLHWRRRSLAGA